MTRQQTTTPTLADILNETKESVYKNLNAVRIGIIEQFNTENQTARISLVDRELISVETGEVLDNAVLSDVPVATFTGEMGGLTYPINQGDECIVLFNDRDIDNWFEAGEISLLNTGRKHSLSDGLAIVGVKSNLKTIQNYINNRTQLSFNQTILSLGERIRVRNQAESLQPILNDLITTLSTLQVDTGTGNLLSNITTELNAILTRINSLFEE